VSEEGRGGRAGWELLWVAGGRETFAGGQVVLMATERGSEKKEI